DGTARRKPAVAPEGSLRRPVLIQRARLVAREVGMIRGDDDNRPLGRSPLFILSAPSASLVVASPEIPGASAKRRWAGVSTSIRRVGEPVAVASSGPSLSHSG